MFELRSYQAAAEPELRAALARHKRVVYVAPTGSGKGVVIAAMAAGAAAKGKKILICVHRRELVQQTQAALAEAGIAAGIIAAGFAETPALPCQIAMISTLTRPARLARWAQWAPDLMLIDECHHLLARSWERLVETFSGAYLVGFSATPIRLDGKGLGRIFKDMVVAATTPSLIAGGYLSPVVCYAPPSRLDLSHVRTVGGDFEAEAAAEAMRRAQLVGDAVDHYRRHVRGASGWGPAIGYACTVAHSQELTAAFAEAGIRARHVDAGTPAETRAAAVAGLATGEIEVVFNVGLFTEGLDVPALAGVLLLRPTKSLGLYLQMCGRALRVAPGKERAVILDHAGNCFQHGLADENHEWSLADRRRRKRTPVPPIKRCPGCAAAVAAAARVCPACGLVFVSNAELPEVADGDLEIADQVSVTRRRIAALPRWQQLRWAGTDPDRLRLVAEIRGYQPGWAWHQRQRAA